MTEDKIYQEAPEGYHYVFTPYITDRNGKRIYHPTGGYYRFLAKNI